MFVLIGRDGYLSLFENAFLIGMFSLPEALKNPFLEKKLRLFEFSLDLGEQFFDAYLLEDILFFYFVSRVGRVEGETNSPVRLYIGVSRFGEIIYMGMLD